MVDKKGQQMTLGTIIAIVLGIVVLVLLVWGFSTGWNNMWSKITSFGGNDVNVDTIAQTCALRCSAGDKYGFCSEERNIVLGDGTKASKSCYVLATSGVVIPEVKNDKGEVTTKGVNVAPSALGIEPCGTLCA